MWLIGELGLAHERHDVGHRFGGLETAEFAKLNPSRLIPVIRDGDSEPIWEAGAILRYLASRHARHTFWPADALERAQIDQWAEWAKVNFAAAFSPIFWTLVRTPPSRRDLTTVDSSLKIVGKWLSIAEGQLAHHAFLAGDTFTLADVPFGTLLYRYFSLDIERPDLPALRRYSDALEARPAYREHVMVSYEALRAVD